MSLVREMLANAVAFHVEVTDTRLRRIVHHYVANAISALNLRSLKASPGFSHLLLPFPSLLPLQGG